MKAILVRSFGGPDVLVSETVADPRPRAGEVVVRIHAAGVNPVETYIRSGQYAAKPNLPYTPGTDGAGIVEAVGEGVSRVRVGDRVYTTGSTSGTYAELAACAQEQVWPLPGGIGFSQGAALSVPYSTAYKALYIRGQARAGQTVLVHGATGGVGLAAVQFASASGLRVFGTGGSEEGREIVRREGAEMVFDHRTPGYADEIMAATGGRGVELIVEMLANVNLDRDLGLLAKFGRIVVVGSRGRIEIDPRGLMRSEGQILAVLSSTPEERAEAQAAVAAGLRAKTLRPIISRELPLAEAAAAHREVMSAKAPGKIVLIP
ncbi:NADPH:quinone reductase [Opitutaceae bacterium EW11]|nr:NADPH:quinone reductase [Opitutaceae bacterium EW11]